jgi:hypothetical protein
MEWTFNLKTNMIRRPVTAKTVASRIISGNYNKNSIGSISLENYIGGKKIYKYMKGGYASIPDLDSSKLNVFSNLKTKLLNLIPYQ